MSFVNGLFSGDKGANFQSQMPNLIQGVNPDQLGTAYTRSQNGLDYQQNFLQALQAASPNIFGAQQQLTDQLTQQAAGGGPNPALAQLNQTTGQNIAGQNALMAGQRGAGANVGLIARQAAQQGVGIQQNAVGQAATMRAQQQLAAQQLLQQQQQAMIGQQQNALSGYNQVAQNNQGLLLGGTGQYNNANVNAYGNANTNNATIAAGNQKFQIGQTEGAIGSAGKAVTALLADGGQIQSDGSVNGPSSEVGKFLCAALGGKVPSREAFQGGGKVPGKAVVKGDSLKNDKIPAKLSPGEIVIPRSIAEADDAPQKAAAFVQAILAKNRGLK